MAEIYHPENFADIELCDRILAALAAAGIVTVTLTYSGSNDEGAVTDVEAKDAANRVVDLADHLSPLDKPHYSSGNRTLAIDCEDMMDLAIPAIQGSGWECGPGGHGDFTIDVPGRKMILDHENDFRADDREDDDNDEDEEG